MSGAGDALRSSSEGMWSEELLVLIFSAVLRGVGNYPSLVTDSLWLCSRCTSVCEGGLPLDLDLNKTLVPLFVLFGVQLMLVPLPN